MLKQKDSRLFTTWDILEYKYLIEECNIPVEFVVEMIKESCNDR